ncbi:MAG: hypothetical protein IKS41_06315 [Alphaproteobacteria bacterium]|nr:hypothetical protein [Alphaproteobacteria bacterium]
MSLFDDAAAFMKNRPVVPKEDEKRENLVKRLRQEFENATRLEVEKALDRLAEREEIPEDFDTVVKKVRIWLED